MIKRTRKDFGYNIPQMDCASMQSGDISLIPGYQPSPARHMNSSWPPITVSLPHTTERYVGIHYSADQNQLPADVTSALVPTAAIDTPYVDSIAT